MKFHAPTGSMKIVTKVERVQPTCIGLDEKGEIVWEGQAMSYWQMLMFKVEYVGDFLAHWDMAHFFRCTGIEHDEQTYSMDISKNRYAYLKKKHSVWGD